MRAKDLDLNSPIRRRPCRIRANDSPSGEFPYDNTSPRPYQRRRSTTIIKLLFGPSRTAFNLFCPTSSSLKGYTQAEIRHA